MKNVMKFSAMFLCLMTASVSYAAMVDCFDSQNRKTVKIQSFTGNKKAKVFYTIAPMTYEVYVLSNSSASRQQLTETYSKVYSNFVNPKPTKTVVYKASRMSRNAFDIIVDGKPFTCMKK